MTKKVGPLQLFRNVVPGDPNEPQAEFEDVSLDVRWGRNIVYDLQGENVPLPGPIHIADRTEQGGKRRKMRFIEVYFFFYTRAQNYRSTGPGSRLFARAYAWQGDNNLIHLMEDMSLLDGADPMEPRNENLLDEDPVAELGDRHEQTLHRLEDLLRDHAQRIHERIEPEERRIHENIYGPDEPQDVMG